MSDLAHFQEFVRDTERSNNYKAWARDNCGKSQGGTPTAPKPGTEVARWFYVRDAVLAQKAFTAPVMTTAYGESLIDAALMAAPETPTPPPPPPPPPPTGDAPRAQFSVRYGGSTGTLDGLTHLEDFDYLVVSAFKLTPALLDDIYRQNPDIKIVIYKALTELGGPGTGTGYAANTAITLAEAEAHDASSSEKWLLRDLNGQIMTPWYGYSGYWGGDPGFQSFQDRAYANIKASIDTFGGRVHGLFGDNMIASIPSTNMAKYRTQPEWENAIAKFIEPGGALKRLKDEGYLVFTNTIKWVSGDHGSNNGSTNKLWWRRVAPGVTGMMQEYWMQNNGSQLYTVRQDKADWMHYYREYSGHVTLAQELGKEFMGQMNNDDIVADTWVALYGRAAFLLKWNGTKQPGLSWTVGGYSGTRDDWTPDVNFPVGLPTEAEVEIKPGAFQRKYSQGLVILNANPTATYTFSNPDGRAYKTGRGTAITFPVTLAPGRALVAKV
jgi:hypothetical protein